MRAPFSRPPRRQRGYLAILFVVILGFVGVMAAMQVLVLTSVASTSRAYDNFRQRSTNLARLERIVTEAVLDQVQVSLAERPDDHARALESRLRQVVVSGVALSQTGALPELPRVGAFPDSAAPPDVLRSVDSDLLRRLPPEMALLVGPRAAIYPDLEYHFDSAVEALGQRRTERVSAAATIVATPLTRFPIAAYELPHEIGSPAGPIRSLASRQQPLGLVPGRDPAFRPDLQSGAERLPYHYRRRAALAAAYQYLYSDGFITRVVEYAGVTHFVDFASTPQPQLDGLVVTGALADWDLAAAGIGRVSGVELVRDAAVITSEQNGQRVRLHDSGGATSAPAMLILLLGPSDPTRGPLAVRLEPIRRPVVIIGCNVAVEMDVGTAVEGALFLDPASSLTATGPITLGHLSYWAGAAGVHAEQVNSGTLPSAAEFIAPRVVYCATRAIRL